MAKLFFFVVAMVCWCGQTSVSMPLVGTAQDCKDHSTVIEDETDDVMSFVVTSVEIHRVASTKMPTQTVVSPDSLPSEPNSEWETQFSQGMKFSEIMMASDEASVASWVFDHDGSSAVVPQQMLSAETLFFEGVKSAPDGKKKDKLAEQALRIYYHAKWLAEHNFAKAAEWRYRESAKLARQCKRNVLASHALSRLGYFMIQWRRYDEAHTVLQESTKLNTKKNPLGPYLFGVLERQRSGSDVARLHAAEELILNSSEQPSKDLQDEREQHIADITYWRNAEFTPARCLQTSNAAKLAICFGCHVARVLQETFL